MTEEDLQAIEARIGDPTARMTAAFITAETLEWLRMTITQLLSALREARVEVEKWTMLAETELAAHQRTKAKSEWLNNELNSQIELYRNDMLSCDDTNNALCKQLSEAKALLHELTDQCGGDAKHDGCGYCRSTKAWLEANK